MPLPKPRKGEKQSDFVSRCTSFAVGDGMPQKQAVAACFDTFRRSKQMSNIKFSYTEPITESALVNDDFIIQGVAINSATTTNNHVFIPEELEKSAHTLNDVPLLKDHENTIDSIMGKVINGTFDEVSSRVLFKAKVNDKKARELIKRGDLNSVSIGASVNEIEEGENGELIPHGITFQELSLVAVPADGGATFNVAMKAALDEFKSSSPSENTQTVERGSKDVKMSEEEVKAEEPEAPAEEPKPEEEKSEESEEAKPEAEKSEEPEETESKAEEKVTLSTSQFKELLSAIKPIKEADVDEESEAKPESEKEEEEAEDEDEDEEDVEEKYTIKQSMGGRAFEYVRAKY